MANAQWVQLSSYPTTENAHEIVLFHDTMIISTNPMGTAGIYISTDHGLSWTPKITSLGSFPFPLVKNANNLYAGTWGTGVFMSSNKGYNWTAKNNGLPVNFMVMDIYTINSNFYVCGTGGVFYSSDNATTWQNITMSGLSQASAIIAVGNTIFSSFIFPSSVGVYKSTNNGVNWTLIDTTSGLKDSRIRKFFLINNLIFATSDFNGNVYRSNDNGNMWLKVNGLPATGWNKTYQIIEKNGIFIMAHNNGVYTSMDNGINWTNIGCTEPSSLAIIGDTLFVGTGYGIWKRSLTQIITSITETQDYNNIKIFPNPATNKLDLELQQIKDLKNSTLSIYDIQGQLMLQQTIEQTKIELNITHFSKGIYVIKLKNNKKSIVSKFIKK